MDQTLKQILSELEKMNKRMDKLGEIEHRLEA